MEEAKRQAIESIYSGGLPFGASLYDENGILLNAAPNLVKQTGNKTQHAEIVLFELLKNKNINYSKTILITTTEPCEKCFNAAAKLGIRNFNYGTNIQTSRKFFKNDKNVSIKKLSQKFNDSFYIEQDIDEIDECNNLFEIYSNNDFLPNVFESVGTLTENYWMEKALKIGREGMIKNGEIPVGVILVEESYTNNGKIVTQSPTMTIASNSLVLHGDFNAILKAERKTLEPDKSFALYTTLEPHLLGFGAAMKARIRKVVYGLEAIDGGAKFFKQNVGSIENYPFIVEGIKRDKQYELFKEYMKIHKNEPDTKIGMNYVKNMINYYENIYLGFKNN